MDAEEFARVARGLRRKLLEIDENFFDRQTAPGQPLVTGPPNIPSDQADPMDIETDPMDAETDSMDIETKRPLAFEALPQNVFDRISGWLTGADAKRLCLSSKALHKAFAHRKWASLSIDQSMFTSDAWSNAFRNQIQPNDGLETDSSLPIAHYVRELNLNDRGLEDLNRRPLEPRTEYENRIARVLDVVSAAENLQYFEFHVLALRRWTGPIMNMEDVDKSRPAELKQFQRPQTAWANIRFVNLYWNRRKDNRFTAAMFELPQRTLTAYMPNLMALQLNLKNFRADWILESPVYKLMAGCYGGTLKRMYLHYCEYCLHGRQDVWNCGGLIFNPAVLGGISRDFKGLEWLAIPGVPVFGEGNGRILVRPFNKAADACTEPLKQFDGLKRLVLEFYQDTFAQDRLPYHHPARKGEENTYILRNIQFARRLLASLPSLEEIYLFSANNTYIRFDRDLIGRMGDSNLLDLVTWGHGDELPAGVWPLGNKREAGNFV